MGCHTWFFRKGFKSLSEANPIRERVNWKWYVTDSEMTHDIFRVGKYPEDRLFSMEETLQFCKEKNVKLGDNQIENLRIFWKQYPDGMIRFG